METFFLENQFKYTWIKIMDLPLSSRMPGSYPVVPRCPIAKPSHMEQAVKKTPREADQLSSAMGLGQ